MSRIEYNGMIEFGKGFIIALYFDKSNTLKMVDYGI